jgi:hypothetical protein
MVANITKTQEKYTDEERRLTLRIKNIFKKNTRKIQKLKKC